MLTLNNTKDHYQTITEFILVQRKMSDIFYFFIDLSELSSHSIKVFITGDVQGKFAAHFLTLE